MVENMLYFRFSVFLVVVFSFNCVADKSDRVRLEEIKALTLHAGRRTTARRSSSVAQLQCVGGSANCNSQYLPKVVQCKNQGGDGSEIQWDCSAELEPQVRFGTVEVICEGYSKPGDSYVLVGSCGLEYYLELTSKGTNGKSQERKIKNIESQTTLSKNVYNIFLLGALALFIYVIYQSCISSRVGSDHGAPPNQPSFHQPPPPYSAHHGAPPTYSTDGAPPPAGFKPEYSQFGGGEWRRRQPYQERLYPDLQQQIPVQQQGPGFWSGAGLGGLLGYMFGSSGTNNDYYNRSAPIFSSTSDNSFTSGSQHSDSSLSGGGGNSRTAHGYGGTSVR